MVQNFSAQKKTILKWGHRYRQGWDDVLLSCEQHLSP